MALILSYLLLSLAVLPSLVSSHWIIKFTETKNELLCDWIINLTHIIRDKESSQTCAKSCVEKYPDTEWIAYASVYGFCVCYEQCKEPTDTTGFASAYKSYKISAVSTTLDPICELYLPLWDKLLLKCDGEILQPPECYTHIKTKVEKQAKRCHDTITYQKTGKTPAETPVLGARALAELVMAKPNFGSWSFTSNAPGGPSKYAAENRDNRKKCKDAMHNYWWSSDEVKREKDEELSKYLCTESAKEFNETEFCVEKRAWNFDATYAKPGTLKAAGCTTQRGFDLSQYCRDKRKDFKGGKINKEKFEETGCSSQKLWDQSSYCRQQVELGEVGETYEHINGCSPANIDDTAVGFNFQNMSMTVACFGILAGFGVGIFAFGKNIITPSTINDNYEQIIDSNP